MDAFRCDRCGKYGAVENRETLHGSVVRGTIKLPGEVVDCDGISTGAWMELKKVDLCADCAKLLRPVLKLWWKPRETLVEFESIEELAEGFGE